MLIDNHFIKFEINPSICINCNLANRNTLLWSIIQILHRMRIVKIRREVVHCSFVTGSHVCVFCRQMKLVAVPLIHGPNKVVYILPVELPRLFYCNEIPKPAKHHYAPNYILLHISKHKYQADITKIPIDSHKRYLIMITSSMETFAALMALCEENSPVTGVFSSQRPVTWSFDVFFDLCLDKRLKKNTETLVIWDAIALIMTSL